MSFPINAEMQNKPMHQMQKAGAFINGYGLKRFSLFSDFLEAFCTGNQRHWASIGISNATLK